MYICSQHFFPFRFGLVSFLERVVPSTTQGPKTKQKKFIRRSRHQLGNVALNSSKMTNSVKPCAVVVVVVVIKYWNGILLSLYRQLEIRSHISFSFTTRNWQQYTVNWYIPYTSNSELSSAIFVSRSYLSCLCVRAYVCMCALCVHTKKCAHTIGVSSCRILSFTRTQFVHTYILLFFPVFHFLLQYMFLSFLSFICWFVIALQCAPHQLIGNHHFWLCVRLSSNM